MKQIYLLIVGMMFLVNMDSVAQPTYAEDIAPIIYNNCTTCHREGEIAPFPLTSFEEVRSRSSQVKYVTEIGYMPPWKADPGYAHLLGETVLSDEEISMIGQWVDNGAPAGDLSLEPSLPDFPEGSLLGEPDLVLEFSEAHLHKGNNQDEYRYFVLPTGLLENKIVKAIELRPGNKKIVHHCLFFEDKNGRAKAADELTPEFGFDAFNNQAGFGIEQVLLNNQYPGYVPGQKPRFYPDGMGQTLSAGSDLVLQMHYAPWSKDEYDQSKVNIFFADENEVVDRFVEDHVMVPLPGVLLNGPFWIPANQVRSFHGVWTLREDVSFLGSSPHMHLLGRDWTIYLEDEAGNEINLISIPDWDFNWQGMYYFPKLIVGKKGWKIHAIATYDNTVSNPFNPNIPPKPVTWGEGTNDEMYYLPLLYVNYREGDENIVFDSILLSNDPEVELEINEESIYSIHPNPGDSGPIYITFDLINGRPVSIRVLDLQGKLVRTIRSNEFFSKGRHTVTLDPSSLAMGIYIVNVSGEKMNFSRKFVRK
jgi:hypothetical protein